jgi:outer membrane protein assembly factor BamB
MKRLLRSVCLFAAAVPALADSPQFRGRLGKGDFGETELPTSWGPNENVRWKVELPGRGLSSPVIAQGRLYLTACTGPLQERLHVLCFDAARGKKLWERQFWATGTTLCHEKTNMAAPTPATDGERVYALFATHDLFCLDRDGDLVWLRALTRDYPTVGNNVGMASSPVVCQNTLLLAMENAGESFAAGLDVLTGENRWKVERPRGINWVTPLVAQTGGQPEVVFQSPEEVTAYAPETGRKRWSFAGKGLGTIASPVVGDGLLLVPGSRFLALRPPGAKKETEQVWQSNKLPTGFASPLYANGKVYAVSFKGVLNCADAATGKALWSERLTEGEYAASPMLAGGKIYVVSEDGTTTVVDPAAATRVVAVNRLGGDSKEEKVLASPVGHDGALYLRSDRYLYCISAKK